MIRLLSSLEITHDHELKSHIVFLLGKMYQATAELIDHSPSRASSMKNTHTYLPLQF